ncbi:hypothetical protein REPUB_Repub04eG0130700 [Reevesia pubescens]
MSQAILAELCTQKFRKNPYLKDSNVQEAINQEYGTWVKISMIRRAKKDVIDKVVNNYKEQFEHLWDYANAIRETNAGNTVKMQVHRPLPTSPAVFQRYYICIAALKTGFMNGCRHFLGLDGCFLKSLTKDELLCVVGRDENNQIFSVAWALVEVEYTSSWR